MPARGFRAVQKSLMGAILAAGTGAIAVASDGILSFPGASGPTSETPSAPASNPTPASQGRMNAVYVCMAQDQTRISLQLDTAGNALLNDPQTGESATGTYSYQNASFGLTVPSFQFQETTAQIEAAAGLLLAFETSSFYCWLLAHEKGEAVQGYVKCPKIKYVPNIGWQVNAFEFYQDHSVKWRQWDEYSALADTTYTESHGTYLIDGNQISMAFGGREKERFLTGTLGQGYTVSIAELEPESGACTPE